MARLRFIADRGVNLPTYYCWGDAISSFCKSEDFAFLADRFGFLNQFTRIDAAAIHEGKLPRFDSSVDFETCMVSRVADIYQRCTKQQCRCYVLWSGGCDSTAVVAALLDAEFPLESLEVIYTKSSVEDYPEFFDYMKTRGVSLTWVPGYGIFHTALERARDGDIVLTGFPADQLFGSILGQRYPGDTTKTHWTKYLSSDLANQQYEAAFEHYNIPITTIAEFLWFNNFALKWDYVCYPGLMMCNDHHPNIISFYDTQAFQDWSASHFDVLHQYDQKDVPHYKIQMKDYIYAVTRLKSVYGLQKVPSIAHAELLEPNPTNPILGVSAIDDAEVITTMPIGHTLGGMRDAGLASTRILRRYLKK